MVGTSISQVSRVWNWYLKEREKNAEIQVLDRRDDMTPDEVQALADHVAALACEMLRHQDFQTEATLSAGSDPVVVIFWGDQHFGALGVDYDLLKKDVDELAALDRKHAFVVGMGDYKDNASPLVHPDSVHEDVVTPWGQDLVVKHYIHRVSPRVLIRGCHDHWDYQTSTQDFVRALCRECVPPAVNLWHGGLIRVHVGDEVYTIRARHKYRRESSLNTTNAQRALADEKGPVDVIALAHKHFPDLQKLWKFEREIVYLRSGTYKLKDEFAQRAGAWSGVYGVPAVLLYPDRHKVAPFWDFREALLCLKGLIGGGD
jgi:hypothetical protein